MCSSDLASSSFRFRCGLVPRLHLSSSYKFLLYLFISTKFVSILCSGRGTKTICHIDYCLTGALLHCCPTTSLQKVHCVSHFPQNYTAIYPPFPLKLKGYPLLWRPPDTCTFAAHVQFNTPAFFFPHMSSLLLLPSTVLCTWCVICIQIVIKLYFLVYKIKILIKYLFK